MGAHSKTQSSKTLLTLLPHAVRCGAIEKAVVDGVRLLPAKVAEPNSPASPLVSGPPSPIDYRQFSFSQLWVRL